MCAERRTPTVERAARRALSMLLLAAIAPAAWAQVRVSPSVVNVSATEATTVFLTYRGLRADQTLAETSFCGALVTAAPDIGARCDPAKFWGQLPARYAHPASTGGGFTDVMSIPPSVVRRAYLSAVKGDPSTYFFVRRIASLTGLPDEYVVVTCRLTAGGADVPLSLTDVRLRFAAEPALVLLRAGDTLPPVAATITYTGTGRLVGRWEVVRPGEAPPEESDLLTEATLPPEQRGSQRRYTEVGRFNVFLPPSGRTALPGPEPARLPTDVDGQYLLLLRIEGGSDSLGTSDGGAVAGFPLPVLRYVVGSVVRGDARADDGGALALVLPREGTALRAGMTTEFVWHALAGAAWYRLEIERDDGQSVHSALLGRSELAYRAPPWLADRAGGDALRWRVVALDGAGEARGTTAWRRLVPAPHDTTPAPR